jgi:hypothetical protein
MIHDNIRYRDFLQLQSHFPNSGKEPIVIDGFVFQIPHPFALEELFESVSEHIEGVEGLKEELNEAWEVNDRLHRDEFKHCRQIEQLEEDKEHLSNELESSNNMVADLQKRLKDTEDILDGFYKYLNY